MYKIDRGDIEIARQTAETPEEAAAWAAYRAAHVTTIGGAS